MESHVHEEGNTYAAGSFNRHKAFLSMCYKAAKIPAPTRDIRGKKANEVDRYLQRGPGGEFERLLKVITEDYPQHLQRFIFSISTGLRWSSQHSATYAMLDELTGVLHLPDSKSGEPIRIPLHPMALAAVRASASYASRSGLIFPGQNGKQARQCHEWFGLACTKAKVLNYSWHANRHTLISRLLQDGASINKVSRLAGHKTLKSTSRYSHYDTESLADALTHFNPSKGTSVSRSSVEISTSNPQVIESKAANA